MFHLPHPKGTGVVRQNHFAALLSTLSLALLFLLQVAGSPAMGGLSTEVRGVSNDYGIPPHLSPGLLSTCTNCVVGNITVDFPDGGTALDPSAGNLFVANWTTDSYLTVANASSNRVVTTLTTEFMPLGVTYDSTNRYIYVCGAGDGIIDVFNGTTDKLVTSINAYNTTGVQNPYSSAFDSANGDIYFVSAGADQKQSANLSIVDGATNKLVQSIPLGLSFAGGSRLNVLATPEGVAIDPYNGEVLVNGGNAINGTNGIAVVSVVTTRLLEALATVR